MVLKPQELSTNCNTRGHLQLKHDPKKVSKAWVEVFSVACHARVPIVAGRGSKAAKSGILSESKGFKSRLMSQTYDFIYFHCLTISERSCEGLGRGLSTKMMPKSKFPCS